MTKECNTSVKRIVKSKKWSVSNFKNMKKRSSAKIFMYQAEFSMKNVRQLTFICLNCRVVALSLFNLKTEENRLQICWWLPIECLDEVVDICISSGSKISSLLHSKHIVVAWSKGGLYHNDEEMKQCWNIDISSRN